MTIGSLGIRKDVGCNESCDWYLIPWSVKGLGWK